MGDGTSIEWTDAKPRKIFVAGMSDLFFEEVTNDEIASVFGIMAESPRHAVRSRRLKLIVEK